MIDTINTIILQNKQEKKEYIKLVSDNTYVSPIVTNIIPKLQNGTAFYTPNYYIVGENEYVYGGNFPDFYPTIDGVSRNYTDNDIL